MNAPGTASAGHTIEMQDKVVVITGGGSGIGEALAVACHEAGARHVVVADLAGEAAAAVAERIGGTGVEIDVRDEAAIIELVAATEDAHGPIDVFVSNAGYVTNGGLEDPNESVQAMWEVHVMAHISAARAVLPSMIANGGGYLLNTASAAGLLTQIGSMAYSVTKHAAVAFAEWVSITHHHQGIGVSVLCPQAVDTNIIKNSPDPEIRAIAEAMEAKGDDGASDLSGGVAAGDGVVSSEDVAAACLAAMAEGRFHVLPHAEVQTYVERKATDVDRWLGGMRRFQTALAGGGPLPGDAIAPKL